MEGWRDGGREREGEEGKGGEGRGGESERGGEGRGGKGEQFEERWMRGMYCMKMISCERNRERKRVNERWRTI